VSEVTLRYVNAQKDRQGRVSYYYFRRHGIRRRLPGHPSQQQFIDAYYALLENGPSKTAERQADRRQFPSGTLGAVINDYLGTAAFGQLALGTQALYRRILDDLGETHGHRLLKHMRRRQVREIRDAHADTPGTANNVLRLVKIICNFAVDEEIIDGSPAAKMKELKCGEHRAWTDDERKRFEDRWASGSMQRRAYALALYTGQRRADQVATTRAHRRGGMVQVRQENGDILWIAEHGALTVELARGEQRHLSLLTTSQGKAFNPVYYGAWFAEAIDKAGLPEDCVLHGLRKCAARALIEAGCSEAEIKSVVGRATTHMIEPMTMMLAKSAKPQPPS
jgi:hypothetical protein